MSPTVTRPPEPPPLTAADRVARGGYVLAEAEAAGRTRDPDVVLVAGGTEVPVALDARRILQREGIATRVVAMPCARWFHEQDPGYREAVLPPGARATVSVGTGTALGWYQLLRPARETVGLDGAGAFASYRALYEQGGLTAQRVAAAARAGLARGPGGSRR
ncbi:transketolase-like TK C-terminal-containing protein [Streptomyces albireticuli]|uniref:Transketolase-like C-terminal domain-containing protein n=1 Tax=Streptomyces albireticuli TaxID=1940 RepID=A0A2A2DEI2_9ACTN|nr:transketolase C-terminal domain-containing protein [Streptomyces albireticuli]MCD9145505.1 hypothetical protein [Streptomyces albireticuli]MCD9165206.1 hypothetical protein [Streptomyces albireticuli]MCD9195735.1 hypothetical protein [Streptomyces albireticuli]PAU49857.1 hypothetical protein CK936_05445 [Streptomyces albireticuli]